MTFHCGSTPLPGVLSRPLPTHLTLRRSVGLEELDLDERMHTTPWFHALELAWHGAKAVYLSFDIDVIDSGFVPGTGWPEPGGLLPCEALALVRGCAEGGLSGMEIVECSPPYDWAEQTSLISARVVLDALASLVRVGKLGNKASTRRPDAWGPYPGDAPRDPTQNYPAGHYPPQREG